MKYFSIKNFDKYQHYKDRNPPWIKTHVSILDDYEFTCLQDASKAHAMLLWVLASKHENKLPWDEKWIGKRISANTPVNLQALEKAGFIIAIMDTASDMLATRKQGATSETETETEAESNTEKTMFVFDEIWKRYPSRDSRKQSEKHFLASVKTAEDWAAINLALTNYLSMLALPDNSWRKPKSGATWFNNWRDWVEFKGSAAPQAQRTPQTAIKPTAPTYIDEDMIA